MLMAVHNTKKPTRKNNNTDDGTDSCQPDEQFASLMLNLGETY